ncbi:translation factor [Planoprotostelium fungivorum]|uniref:Threonylcarbamoyl-AMP synthase n=1 Tax=Planoprotostelium fungivorum TaxID=1890364 RepID=A0A2P6NXV2_9EUKA|nr:translation factor [Planoprotostelium fungivorum]
MRLTSQCLHQFSRKISNTKHMSRTTIRLTDDLTAMGPAIDLLRNGEVVAFPTETVYGLGANALNSSAVQKIFTAKGRPSDNPLIVHISSLNMLKDLVAEEAFPRPGTTIHKLCEELWPGAITFLFPKSDRVPDNVTAGQPTVAVRMPSHPIAKYLIETAGVPVAAPSANVSGRPSPTKAEHVLQDLDGIIPCVIDGGNTNYGLESTVLDINRDPPLILRPGGVTFEQLKKLIPNVQVYERSVHGSQMAEKPATPGLKYRHYSPNALVLLFEYNSDPTVTSLKEKMKKRVEELKREGKRIGIIHVHSGVKMDEEWMGDQVIVYPLGDESRPDVVAQGIFSALRSLDDKKVDCIMVEGISEENEGMAVMNRVRKAAAETIQ